MINILFIQPPVMKRIKKENPVIQEYFDTVNAVGNYLGDSPFEPNLGLLSIASAVKKWSKEETNIQLLDLNFVERNIRQEKKLGITLNNIKKELDNFPNVDVIGISFMTSTYGIWGLDIIKLCRDKFGSSHIFLGGIHPTVRYKEIYNSCKNKNIEIDGIVVGEGERVFCDIIDSLKGNTAQKLNEHPHIYRGDGQNKNRALLNDSDLSDLPIPAYDLMPKSEPLIIRLYTTRDCSQKCTFCSASKIHKTDNIISRGAFNPDKILNDLQKIVKKYNVKHFVIGDLSFLNDQNISTNLLKKLEKFKIEHNLKWWCQCRADAIRDKKTVELLKKIGLAQIAIGCEAGTNEQLATITKEETVETIETTLKLIHEQKDIEIQGYWIIGLPYDTREKIKKTQDLILNYIRNGYNTIPHITVLVPYPGSQIAKQPKGIKINNLKKWKDYWMNCDAYGCGEPVYETVDNNQNTLLTSKEIYGLWLETLQLVTNELKNKNQEK